MHSLVDYYIDHWLINSLQPISFFVHNETSINKSLNNCKFANVSKIVILKWNEM